MAVINCPLSVDIVIADRIKKYFFLAVAVIKNNAIFKVNRKRPIAGQSAAEFMDAQTGILRIVPEYFFGKFGVIFYIAGKSSVKPFKMRRVNNYHFN